MTHIGDALDGLNTTQSDVRDLQEQIAALLATRLCCAECFGQNTLAQRRGTPEEQLPPINAAIMVVNGLSVCPEHVQFNSPLLVQP